MELTTNARVRISQKSAVLLEHARRHGFTDEQLLTCISANDMKSLQAAEDDYYKYDEWANYAREHGEDLAAAIQEGYQMTFNTVFGVKRWLKERLGLIEIQNYSEEEGRMDGLMLSAADAELLSKTIAANWVIVKQDHLADGMVPTSIVMKALIDENAHF